MILKSRFLLCILAGALISACGGKNDDTVSPGAAGDAGGSLTMGSERANTVITEQNKKSACEDVFKVIYTVYNKSFLTMISADDYLSSMRIEGSNYGYAVTEGFSELSGNTIDGVDLKFDLTFYDYSDNGKLYLGGKLTFESHMDYKDESWVSRYVHVDLKAAFAGDYKGMMQFENMLFPVNENGQLFSVFAADSVLSVQPYDGKVIITSGSNTISFNPFYRFYIPEDPIPE
jgi:hypothetical protein